MHVWTWSITVEEYNWRSVGLTWTSLRILYWLLMTATILTLQRWVRERERDLRSTLSIAIDLSKAQTLLHSCNVQLHLLNVQRSTIVRLLFTAWIEVIVRLLPTAWIEVLKVPFPRIKNFWERTTLLKDKTAVFIIKVAIHYHKSVSLHMYNLHKYIQPLFQQLKTPSYTRNTSSIKLLRSLASHDEIIIIPLIGYSIVN